MRIKTRMLKFRIREYWRGLQEHRLRNLIGSQGKMLESQMFKGVEKNFLLLTKR